MMSDGDVTYECLAPVSRWGEDRSRVVVTVITRWKGKGPRNVLVEGASCRWVRPFRGLRKITELMSKKEEERKNGPAENKRQ